MVFTLGPSVHLPRLATRAGLGTTSRSSGIVRFVQGGVVKSFRWSTYRNLMAADKAPSQPWDATWQIALARFDKLVVDWLVLASVREVIATLIDMPEIRGLFIKSSMFTAFLTPYSSYPDFFNGRRITIDADGDSAVTVRFLRVGFDQSPSEHTFTVDVAPTQIAALCREHL